MDAIFKWLNLGITVLIAGVELYLLYDMFYVPAQGRGDAFLPIVFVFLLAVLLGQIVLSLAFCYRWRVRWVLQIMIWWFLFGPKINF